MDVNSYNINNFQCKIVEYISSKYGWDNSLYEIKINNLMSNDEFIWFIVFHNDDKKPSHLGGGKSLLIKFDISAEKIIEELGFQ